MFKIVATGADVQNVIQRQVELEDRIEFEFIGGADVGFNISRHSLEQMISDVMKIVTSHANVKSLSVYLTTLPSVDQIIICADYWGTGPLPRLRWLGRTDKERPLDISGWPQNCSAAFFDNGYEYIYSISISKRSI
jgi:hypothetical protein